MEFVQYKFPARYSTGQLFCPFYCNKLIVTSFVPLVGYFKSFSDLVIFQSQVIVLLLEGGADDFSAIVQFYITDDVAFLAPYATHKRSGECTFNLV